MTDLYNIFSFAQFVTSAASYKDLPTIGWGDIAFSGRSNVGKSSLINALTQKKRLAKTSKRPGKTQLLNIFSIKEECALVDLPGYGYANLSHTEAQNISLRIQHYLQHRRALSLLVLCIDVRRGFMGIDHEWIRLVAARENVPWLVLANKCDKLSQKERAEAHKKFQKFLCTSPKPPLSIIFTSTTREEGLDQLHRCFHTIFTQKCSEMARAAAEATPLNPPH